LLKIKPVSAERLPELLRLMPKAELHMHVEGSLEPELMFALAQRNGMATAYPDVESLRRAYVFGDLQSVLDIYHAGTLVLRTEQDFYDMTRAYLVRAASDNALHAEIFFDTQTHTGHGLSVDLVINGLHRACLDARDELGISAGLILCFLRHLSEQEAFAALEQALPHRDKLVGVGLASSEMAIRLRSLLASLPGLVGWACGWSPMRGRRGHRLTSGARLMCSRSSALIMACKPSKTDY